MTQETIKAAEGHAKLIALKISKYTPFDSFIAGAEYGYHAAEYESENKAIDIALAHHETYTSMVEKQQQIDELVEGIELAIQLLQDNENFMANTAKGALTGLIQKHRP